MEKKNCLDEKMLEATIEKMVEIVDMMCKVMEEVKNTFDERLEQCDYEVQCKVDYLHRELSKCDDELLDTARKIEENTALGLFGQWIKWLLLSVITFGIYSFWVSIALEKWRVKHTEFE